MRETPVSDSADTDPDRDPGSTAEHDSGVFEQASPSSNAEGISELSAAETPATAEHALVSNTLCAQTVERLFFAYRDFTDEPDARLEERGLGRAHHRVIHFVSRHPGLAVHDLLDILKITKQSLARVLKQLIDDGFITQAPGPTDRRKRLLYATPSGRALAESLAELQTTRIANAYQSAIDAAGPDASRAILAFLSGMVRPEDRAAVDRLIATNTAPAVSTSSQPLT